MYICAHVYTSKQQQRRNSSSDNNSSKPSGSLMSRYMYAFEFQKCTHHALVSLQVRVCACCCLLQHVGLPGSKH